MCIPDDFDDDYVSLREADYEGEVDFGPVRVKGRSRNSDDSGAVIAGVLAGGAVAIGAVAVTLSLLGGSSDS